LLVYRYEYFFYFRVQQLIRLSHGAVSDANAGTPLYYASAITVEYLFLQPLSLLLPYLAPEGLARAAAFLTEEILPTLPSSSSTRLGGVFRRPKKKLKKDGEQPAIHSACSIVGNSPRRRSLECCFLLLPRRRRSPA